MIDISIFCETGERKMEPNEQSIHTLLMRTAHKQRNYLRPYLSEIGLSTGQPKVLQCLNACGSCSQRKLADACEVDPSAICRMLDSMEREGLVQRQPSPESRREGIVRLIRCNIGKIRIWKIHLITHTRCFGQVWWGRLFSRWSGYEPVFWQRTCKDSERFNRSCYAGLRFTWR